MSDVRVRKLQEFIKQEVSQMLSLDYSMHIESLLNEIKKDEEKN